MIEPSVGSAGGTKINVWGTGFGPSTPDINLRADGDELCHSVEIYEYGKFWCYTNAMDVANGAVMTITLDGSADSNSFVASDAVFE